MTLVFKALSYLRNLKYSSRKLLSFTYEIRLDIQSVVPFFLLFLVFSFIPVTLR